MAIDFQMGQHYAPPWRIIGTAVGAFFLFFLALMLGSFLSKRFARKSKSDEDHHRGHIGKGKDGQARYDGDLAGQLKELSGLYEKGHISEGEFTKAKKKLLG